MNSKIAFLVSVIFHPGIMPTAAFGLLVMVAPELVNVSSEASVMLQLLGLIFTGTLVFPLLSLLVLYHYRYITSLSLKHKKERVLPLLITSLYLALMAYYFTYRLNLGTTVSSLMLGIAFASLASTTVSAFYQISIHAIGIGGILGLLLGLQIKYPSMELLSPVLLTVIISGLISSSRLKLNAHTFNEILWGNCLGTVISFLAIVFLT